MSARLRPLWGASAYTPKDGERTRSAQTALAEKSIRGSGSAAYKGGRHSRNTSRVQT